MCRRDWYAIPRALRDQVWATWQSGRDMPGAEHQEASGWPSRRATPATVSGIAHATAARQIRDRAAARSRARARGSRHDLREDPRDRGIAVSRVQASSAVRALLGREVLARLRGECYERYACCVCGERGRTDAEPASVIVERYRLPAVRVRMAHARCAASQVVEIAVDSPDASGFGGMLSKAAVLEYVTEPRVRPLLILEPATELSEPTPGGEQCNLLLSGLLDRGFTMLRTAAQLPPLADGWLLRLDSAGSRLLAPDQTVVYDGPIDPPGPWPQLVHRTGACVVLIGTVGLYARADQECDTGELRRLLNYAARAGELAGALIRVHHDGL
jgi:hypothetical protein